MRRGLPTIFGALLLACEGEGEPEPEPEPAPPVVVPSVEAPRVEYAGCEEIENDVCVLVPKERQIDVWLDVHGAAQLDVRVDDVPVAFTRHPVDGGLRIRIEVPPGSRALSVAGIDPHWEPPWSLPLGDISKPDVIARALKLQAAGKGAKAIVLLEGALEKASDRDRLQILDVLRRLLHDRGDARASLRRATEHAELAHRLGLPRAEVLALAAAAYLAGHETGDTEAARAFIARIRAHDEELPEAPMMAAYQNSILAFDIDDMISAQRELGEAERIAARLGLEEMAEISSLLAIVLLDLGRGAEALATTRRSIEFARSLSCINQARQLNNAGFTQLVLAEHDLDHEPAAPLLESALARVEPDGECPSASLHADILVSLALAALEEGEPEDALEHLARIDELPTNLEPWVEAIHGRVGLDTGRWELIPALVVHPHPAASAGLRWDALERQAQLLERLGSFEAAVAAHLAAEQLLEDGTNGMAGGIGGELFLAGRAASSRGLVRMLVQAGRFEEAFCRARLARGRVLRRLDRVARVTRAPPAIREEWRNAVRAFAATRDRLARDSANDWELSQPERERAQARRTDERREATEAMAAAFEAMGGRHAPQCDDLPSPRAGEQVLLPFPLDSGWIVFLADEHDVTAFEIAEPDPSGTDLLDALDPALVASRLRILPTERSWSIPFHALTDGTAVLLDDVVVSYGLDLDPVDPTAMARSAVIVSDPSEDLPMARAEADAVEKRLRGAGWTVAARSGPAATRAGIAKALAGASLLHYAGHGVHRGETGWDAALLLPEGDALSVPDILALPAVPPTVVLTGCETGLVAAATPGGGMNVGRAFVLAGAQAVLVVDEKVDDALARRVGESLYEDGGDVDPAAALRRVQLRLRDEGLEGWASFRVVTR